MPYVAEVSIHAESILDVMQVINSNVSAEGPYATVAPVKGPLLAG